jgi:hypothetical protein
MQEAVGLGRCHRQSVPVDSLNVIVSNEFVREFDRNTLFPDEEDVLVLRPGHNKDMFNLLVILGAFTSRSQAKKNWTKTDRNIPAGWSEFFVGKKRRHLCTWNPTE